MRSPLRIALAVAAFTLAACQDDLVSHPSATCRSAPAPCASNADCCSYGCVWGYCADNPLEGGMCKTTNDCAAPRVCVAEKCTAAVACRAGGDTCAYSNECCSGLCGPTTRQCTANNAPIANPGPDVTVPHRSQVTLVNESTDPDTGYASLTFQWSFLEPGGKPAGSIATFSSPSAPTPTFTPDVPGNYYVLLTASDGFLSHTEGVVVTAVNFVPDVSAGANVDRHSRNVPLAFSGNVADRNGDVITCRWTVTKPSGVTETVRGDQTCSGVVPASITPDVEGAWILTLHATDGIPAASGGAPPWVADSRTVIVVNDTPVANAGPDRVANLGAPGTTAPAVVIAGTATDVNSDVGQPTFTWTWKVTAVPEGVTTSYTVGQILQAGADAATLSFVPDALGAFTLELAVDDARPSPDAPTDTDTVVVEVHRYVRPLATIVDAVYLKGSDRIVMVGTDSSGAVAVHRLWLLDPSSQAAPATAILAAQPTCLSVSPDGTQALVGEAGASWERVSLSATPVASGQLAAPFVPTDVVHAGTRAFAVGSSGSVYELELAAAVGTLQPYALATCPSCAYNAPPRGTRAVGTATAVWLLDGSSTLGRYDLQGSHLVPNPATRISTSPATNLWLSADGVDLFASSGSVYVSQTLGGAGSLPVSPVHVDTSIAGTLLHGVAATTGTLLTRFDAGFSPATGTLALPKLAGTAPGYQTAAKFAFVRSDASRHYAIVSATVGTSTQFGLVEY